MDPVHLICDTKSAGCLAGSRVNVAVLEVGTLTGLDVGAGVGDKVGVGVAGPVLADEMAAALPDGAWLC
jgi:hypothetical protein